MIYMENDRKYSLSYQELKNEYHTYLNMTNEEFLSDIPRLLHFICIVCYLKEVSSEVLLGDEGLIHLLIHRLDGTSSDPITNNISIKQLRKQFKQICSLA